VGRIFTNKSRNEHPCPLGRGGELFDLSITHISPSGLHRRWQHAIGSGASGARGVGAPAWMVASGTAIGGTRRSPTSTAARRILLPAVSKGAGRTTCSTSRASASPLRRRYASRSASPACPCPRRPCAAAHQHTSSTHTASRRNRVTACRAPPHCRIILARSPQLDTLGDDGSPSCKGGRYCRSTDDRAMGSAARCLVPFPPGAHWRVLPGTGFEPQRR